MQTPGRSSLARVERADSDRARSASRGRPGRIPSAVPTFTKGSGPGCPSLRASNEALLRARVLRARRAPGRSPPLLLNLRSNADYPLVMELPDLKDDPYLKVLRPLVEAYLAFWRIDIRHIKSLRLTPSQFDVIATLGDTEGMTCSELSAHTLVTKGTLTGVLDRLASKGLIRRDAMKNDRRCTKISLTVKGDALFRKTFAAHLAFLRPFFERALSPEEVDQARALLLRLRDSFRQKIEAI